jgi:hypothetical protein
MVDQITTLQRAAFELRQALANSNQQKNEQINKFQALTKARVAQRRKTALLQAEYKQNKLVRSFSLSHALTFLSK